MRREEGKRSRQADGQSLGNWNGKGQETGIEQKPEPRRSGDVGRQLKY